MKYLVLFYLREMLKEKKQAARMHTHMLSPPMIPLGSPARQCSGALSSRPGAHGLSVIKGCREQTGEGEKLLKLYLAYWCSPLSKQQTSYEIRCFMKPVRLSLAATTPRGFQGASDFSLSATAQKASQKGSQRWRSSSRRRGWGCKNPTEEDSKTIRWFCSPQVADFVCPYSHVWRNIKAY